MQLLRQAWSSRLCSPCVCMQHRWGQLNSIFSLISYLWSRINNRSCSSSCSSICAQCYQIRCLRWLGVNTLIDERGTVPIWLPRNARVCPTVESLRHCGGRSNKRDTNCGHALLIVPFVNTKKEWKGQEPAVQKTWRYMNADNCFWRMFNFPCQLNSNGLFPRDAVAVARTPWKRSPHTSVQSIETEQLRINLT